MISGGQANILVTGADRGLVWAQQDFTERRVEHRFGAAAITKMALKKLVYDHPVFVDKVGAREGYTVEGGLTRFYEVVEDAELADHLEILI